MRRAVHPRERGEHAGRFVSGLGVEGSSPRARGTLKELLRRSRLDGFIPASAGNTRGHQRYPVSLTVHPRERGEHWSGRWLLRSPCGSSPRARGTQRNGRGFDPRRRFIPASAGNTVLTECLTAGWGGSSPRARGTHGPRGRRHHQDRFIPASAGNTPGVSDGLGFCHGSSPRARGTPDRLRGVATNRRFIPASAGNTSSASWPGRVVAVHPRERGEHMPLAPGSHTVTGSSPRARGTHAGVGVAANRHRFIPASAGNTRPRRLQGFLRPVHPRERGEHVLAAAECPGGLRFIPASAGNTDAVEALRPPLTVHPRERGEHPRPRHAVSPTAGSSPRARGTRIKNPDSRKTRRFIPASAGNTDNSPSAKGQTTVHPRERGEHGVRKLQADAVSGSSPRARGTRTPRSLAGCGSRFIPASAGNTRASGPRCAA